MGEKTFFNFDLHLAGIGVQKRPGRNLSIRFFNRIYFDTAIDEWGKFESRIVTVADCFKYRNKIGLDVALEALRECQRDKKCNGDDLWHFARVCRVSNVMRPYMEAMVMDMDDEIPRWSGHNNHSQRL